MPENSPEEIPDFEREEGITPEFKAAQLHGLQTDFRETLSRIEDLADQQLSGPADSKKNKERWVDDVEITNKLEAIIDRGERAIQDCKVLAEELAAYERDHPDLFEDRENAKALIAGTIIQEWFGDKPKGPFQKTQQDMEYLEKYVQSMEVLNYICREWLKELRRKNSQ